MLYQHMCKISKHHTAGLAVILGAILFLVFLYPRILLAQAPFAGRITTVSPEPPPSTCVNRFNLAPVRGSPPTICQGAGFVRPVRPCAPGRYLIGFRIGGFVARAWCG